MWRRRLEGEAGPHAPRTHEEAEADFAYLGLPAPEEGVDRRWDAVDEDEDEDVDYIDSTCSGILDVIFTGEVRTHRALNKVDGLTTLQTPLDRGTAWGRYTYLGRVRVWDGLIALVRSPVRVPNRPSDTLPYPC